MEGVSLAEGEPASEYRSWRVVRVFRGVHQSLGGWYWFILVTMSLITLHTFDHTSALVLGGSPFSDTVIGADNTEGFVLYHGTLTIADWVMTVVLLLMLYRRWPTAGDLRVEDPFKRPAEVLRRLHRVLGKVYWFMWGAMVPVTAHAMDHAIFMALGTSPLSDTIVAKSFSDVGFLAWHSGLTILDFSLSIVLIRLLYLRWKASQKAVVSAAAPSPSATET